MPDSRTTVFITGASSGLGRGLALHCAKAAATVFAAARREEELAKLAAEAPPGTIVAVHLDVQDSDFFLNALPPPEISSLSLPDLLPTSSTGGSRRSARIE